MSVCRASCSPQLRRGHGRIERDPEHAGELDAGELAEREGPLVRPSTPGARRRLPSREKAQPWKAHELGDDRPASSAARSAVAADVEEGPRAPVAHGEYRHAAKLFGDRVSVTLEVRERGERNGPAAHDVPELCLNRSSSV